MQIPSVTQGLQLDETNAFPIYYSAGLDCTPQAELVQGAYAYYSELLGGSPAFSLMVLAPDDWRGRAAHPAYGMPHLGLNHTLVVGSESGDFMQQVVPLLAQQLPQEMPRLREVYGDPVDPMGFFGLLVVHELAHIFQMDVPMMFPREWLGELFANLAMVTYFSDRAVDWLPQAQVLPEVLARLDIPGLTHTTLRAFETEPVAFNPLNYVWYQVRLYVMAIRLYQAAGREALLNLWRTFALDDIRLAHRLAENVAPETSDLLRAWPDVY